MRRGRAGQGSCNDVQGRGAGERARAALKIPICSKCANGQDNSICVTTKWGTSSEAGEERAGRRAEEEERREERRRGREAK